MQRSLSILSRGWLGNAHSVETFGYFFGTFIDVARFFVQADVEICSTGYVDVEL